jgi:hypothetical protein
MGDQRRGYVCAICLLQGRRPRVLDSAYALEKHTEQAHPDGLTIQDVTMDVAAVFATVNEAQG